MQYLTLPESSDSADSASDSADSTVESADEALIDYTIDWLNIQVLNNVLLTIH